MEAFYELPSQIELTREEYRLMNAGLEAGLEACDAADSVPAELLRSTIEAALRLLARRIWPDLDALDNGGEH